MRCIPCKKGRKYFFLLIFIAAICIQFVPVDRTNPPSTGMIDAPPEVMAILKRSCFDCHSNETIWLWYTYVAPMSWLVTNDVNNGRKHLNFSVWSQYTTKRQNYKRKEIGEEVEEGEMPLWFYLPLHPEAKLSQENVDLLISWSKVGGSKVVGSEKEYSDHDHSAHN